MYLVQFNFHNEVTYIRACMQHILLPLFLSIYCEADFFRFHLNDSSVVAFFEAYLVNTASYSGTQFLMYKMGLDRTQKSCRFNWINS